MLLTNKLSIITLDLPRRGGQGEGLGQVGAARDREDQQGPAAGEEEGGEQEDEEAGGPRLQLGPQDHQVQVGRGEGTRFEFLFILFFFFLPLSLYF